MRSEYLKYVLDTQAEGSISLAAKRNFISPQGLGRAIAVVEDELGFEIFHRGSNSLTLTAAGERIFPAISRAVAAMGDLRAEAARIAQGADVSTSVVLCSPVVFTYGTIAQLYQSLAGRATDLRFVQMGTSGIIETFCDFDGRYGDLRSTVGIVLLVRPHAKQTLDAIERLRRAGCMYRPYLEYLDGVLVPADSPLASKKPLTMRDLASQPIISSSAETQPVLEETFGQAAVEMVVPDPHFRAQLVRDGRGITFYPRFVAEHMDFEGAVYRPYEEGQRIQVGFVSDSSYFSTSVGRTLLDGLDACFRPLADGKLLWMLT